MYLMHSKLLDDHKFHYYFYTDLLFTWVWEDLNLKLEKFNLFLWFDPATFLLNDASIELRDKKAKK
jgi:hypothetical protein